MRDRKASAQPTGIRIEQNLQTMQQITHLSLSLLTYRSSSYALYCPLAFVLSALSVFEMVEGWKSCRVKTGDQDRFFRSIDLD